MQDFAHGYVYATKNSAYVKTGNGIIRLEDVQIEGKKSMNIATFLTGGKLKSGVVLGE